MKSSNLATAAIGPQPYSGIYLRNNLASQGTIPAQGPLNLCPDIIQSDSAVTDPAKEFGSPQSWSQMYGVDPTIGVANYYYVRGKNGSTASDTGTMSLYWAPAQVFNFPSAWKGNEMSTATGKGTTAVSAGPGQIAVGADPFLWTPGPLTTASTYLNFVCRSVDRANPNPIPVIGSWLDLANLLANEPGTGFRNSAVVDGQAATWTHRQVLSVPGFLPSAQVQIMLLAQGFTGTAVGLLCDTFTPSRQIIEVAPTPVVGDGIVTGIVAQLDPGYQTSLAVTCWNPSGVSAGSTLSLLITMPIQSADMDFALSHGLARYQRGAHEARIGPTPVATIANITFMAGAEMQNAMLR
jgi:hypothetical protein